MIEIWLQDHKNVTCSRNGLVLAQSKISGPFPRGMMSQWIQFSWNDHPVVHGTFHTYVPQSEVGAGDSLGVTSVDQTHTRVMTQWSTLQMKKVEKKMTHPSQSGNLHRSSPRKTTELGQIRRLTSSPLTVGFDPVLSWWEKAVLWSCNNTVRM